MKILVTGGCGFIGSNFIRYLLEEVGSERDVFVVNLDKQTYAGIGRNIEHMSLSEDKRYRFVKGDICDKELVEELFRKENFEIVFNFAAESHVDRSIDSSLPFAQSNVLGVVNLLESARKFGIGKFIQIGTDEVYGSLSPGDKSSEESDALKPRSPYSASKASADNFALSYYETYGVSVIITRSSNNYGIYQYPEKIIPLFITNLIEGKKVPLMWSEKNPGLNVRDWLHVVDNCRAIWFIALNGKTGEIYNISGENERRNIDVTRIILKEFGYGDEMIEKVLHRKGHDFRYSIDNRKLKRLGFKLEHKDFENELKKVCEWYKENLNWWRVLKGNGFGKEECRLIVFGKGFLGKRIAGELGFRLVGREVDVLNDKELADFLDKEKPEVVINAIGKTGRPNIDWCEDNKEETILSNVSAAVNLGLECFKRGIYFVHLSSGCIYEGDNGGEGFSEEDEPNFNGSFYSRSKSIAEKILKEFPCLIIRLRMPIDDRPHDRNLVDKLKKYSRVIDAKNSITYVPDLIEVLRVLIEKRRVGVYNLVNSGVISGAEIMEMYKEIVDFSHDFEVISAEELNKTVKAERSNCVLNIDKLRREGIEMPDVRETIRKCLEKYKENLSSL